MLRTTVCRRHNLEINGPKEMASCPAGRDASENKLVRDNKNKGVCGFAGNIHEGCADQVTAVAEKRGGNMKVTKR